MSAADGSPRRVVPREAGAALREYLTLELSRRRAAMLPGPRNLSELSRRLGLSAGSLSAILSGRGDVVVFVGKVSLEALVQALNFPSAPLTVEDLEEVLSAFSPPSAEALVEGGGGEP